MDKYDDKAKSILSQFAVEDGYAPASRGCSLVAAVANALVERDESREELIVAQRALLSEGILAGKIEKERDEAREKLVAVGQELLEERARAAKAEMELFFTKAGKGPNASPPPDASRIKLMAVEAENDMLRESLREVIEWVKNYPKRIDDAGLREIIEKEQVRDV